MGNKKSVLFREILRGGLLYEDMTATEDDLSLKSVSDSTDHNEITTKLSIIITLRCVLPC